MTHHQTTALDAHRASHPAMRPVRRGPAHRNRLSRFATTMHRSREDTVAFAILVAICCAILSLAVALPLYGQTNRGGGAYEITASENPGTLKGIVLDATNGDALPRANIMFHRLVNGGDDPAGRDFAGGTITWDEGTFEQEFAPGKYVATFIYIGYENLEMEFEILPGQTVEVTARLKVEPIAVDEEVQVETIAPRDNEAGALVRQRKAATVSDAVTGEQISRNSDSNAAEALTRVTGVSVVGGKYVFVRGLGDRYSSTQINGASLSSPEPNKRTVPLDIFPSSLIDNVVVQKTYSPDMEGEFGGGNIRINTREFVDRRVWKHSLAFGYQSNALDHGRLQYTGGNTDFLGYDDGTRAIPAVIQNEQQRIDRGSYSIDELKDFRRAFENIWSPQQESGRPNFSYAGEYAEKFSVFERPLGVLVSGSFKNSVGSLQRTENTYRGGNPPDLTQMQMVDESTYSVLWGLNSSLVYQATPNQKYTFNLVYSHDADDRVRIAEGPNEDHGRYMRQYQLNFVERSLLSTVLKGQHDIFLNSIFNWQGSYAEANRDEPDRRNTTYERALSDEEAEPVLSRRLAHPMERVYGDSHEYDRNVKLDWQVPVTSNPGFLNDLKLGWSYRDKDRTSEYRRFGFRCRSFQCGELSMEPEELLDPETNERADNYVVEELTRANDTYSAYQAIRAGYGMVDTRIGSHLRVSWGVRYEESDQSVSARSPFALEDDGTYIELKSRDLLPAINGTWAFSDRMNLRLSYSRTLNRPELRELSPFSIYNYETNFSHRGNEDLVQAEIQAVDLRWEFYPQVGQYLGAAVFYKDLENPIEKIVEPTSGAYSEFPRNGDRGELKGFELDLRVPVGEIWDATVTPLGGSESPYELRRLGLVTNFSRVYSSVTIPVSGAVLETPLTGQSTYSLNLGLYHTTPAFQTALLYRGFGRRLASHGLGVLDDIYEHPMQSLDFSVSWKFRPTMLIKFAAENLLNEPINYFQGDLLVRHWLPGREFKLGFSYNR